MDEIFPPSFIGKEIPFASGRVTLTKKLFENSCRYTEEEWKELGDPISCAYGTFECTNAGSPSKTALVRVFMQIPHIGPLHRTAEEIRAQASSRELDYYSQTEVDGYTALKKGGCKHVRELIDFKFDTQSAQGLVPGGYLVFLLLSKVPGVRLDSVYWGLGFTERQQIRQSFRVAWESCIKSGIHVTAASLASLVWDKQNKMIYIIGIQGCEPAEPRHIWRDVLWLTWCLAKPPSGYRYSRKLKSILILATG